MGIDKDSEAYRLAVAAEIKRRRIAVDLSMNRLGENSGLSQPMIGLIERGVHMPTVTTLFRIARSLGTSPAQLLASVETVAPERAGKPAAKSPPKVAPAKPAKPAKKTVPVKKKRSKPL